MPMDKDELLLQLAGSIFHDPALADHEWDTVSTVFVADGSSVSWYCYSYLGAAPTAVSLEGDDLYELLLDFQEATVSPNGSAWKTCLFRLDREGEVEVDFEHDDADRWRVTPDTLDTIHERIRMGKQAPAKKKAAKEKAAKKKPAGRKAKR